MDSGPVRTPEFETTTRLFARSLGWTPQALLEALRPAVPEDLPALVAFRARRGWDDEAYLRWRYGLDSADGNGHGRLWLLRRASSVIAVIGVEKQPIRYRGAVHDGQLLMDVQLDSAAEGAGGGVWLNQAMFRKAPITLAVGANTHSLGLVRRLFLPLPPRSYYVLPLDAGAMLRQHGVPGLLAGVAGPVIGGAWRLRAGLSGPRDDGGTEVREIAGFSDALLQPLYAGLEADEASIAPAAAQLNWRLQDNPRAQYRVLAALRDRRCVGYLAMRRLVDANGMTGMHIIDWKTVAERADDILACLLRQAVAMARQERCQRLFTTALDRRAGPLLGRIGFLRGRPSEHLLTGIRTELPLPGAGAPGSWRITDLSFDNDGCY
ncbi:hypothetical protein [Pseudoxanthomonas wuyuanensis]|uniref:Acetyltransferase (GNAT) domain-containing protein n=1 Tax=Pseudoxanthomonas wuyuanensis TaxID=1073196 RepID=A0A286CYE0_9GAMM|nr:hypothetical protein [Pseudoxanthomonas wuyuanensis]KAF1722721.1 hypothetical protein CSC75_02535 [Pseudoxanthomonas wuyuanensis]SOD51400.1 hypothetical protein SAMN06296416_101604 [Pseudoxanthomonas wuyuanensis]